MKLLIDNMLSIHLVRGLADAGFEAQHVRDVGLAASPDVEIAAYARKHRFTVLSADRDFGTILTETQATEPSVIYLRGPIGRRPDAIVDLLAANRSELTTWAERNCIIVIEPGRMRIRELPIRE